MLENLESQLENCQQIQEDNSPDAFDFGTFIRILRSSEENVYREMGLDFFAKFSSEMLPQSLWRREYRVPLGVFNKVKHIVHIYEEGNITKLELANQLASGDLYSEIRIRVDEDLQRDDANLQNLRLKLVGKLDNLANMTLPPRTAEIIQAFYRGTNVSLFSRYYSNAEWLSELAGACSSAAHRSLFHQQNRMRSQRSTLKDTMDKVMGQLLEFRKSCDLTADAILDNFVELNIFYPELKMQAITQQRSYGFWDLLSDVGGGMGLFLGASFLTLFEILGIILQATASRIFSTSVDISKSEKSGNKK